MASTPAVSPLAVQDTAVPEPLSTVRPSATGTSASNLGPLARSLLSQTAESEILPGTQPSATASLSNHGFVSETTSAEALGEKSSSTLPSGGTVMFKEGHDEAVNAPQARSSAAEVSAVEDEHHLVELAVVKDTTTSTTIHREAVSSSATAPETGSSTAAVTSTPSAKTTPEPLLSHSQSLPQETSTPHAEAITEKRETESASENKLTEKSAVTAQEPAVIAVHHSDIGPVTQSNVDTVLSSPKHQLDVATELPGMRAASLIGQVGTISSTTQPPPSLDTEHVLTTVNIQMESTHGPVSVKPVVSSAEHLDEGHDAAAGSGLDSVEQRTEETGPKSSAGNLPDSFTSSPPTIRTVQSGEPTTHHSAAAGVAADGVTTVPSTVTNSGEKYSESSEHAVPSTDGDELANEAKFKADIDEILMLASLESSYLVSRVEESSDLQDEVNVSSLVTSSQLSTTDPQDVPTKTAQYSDPTTASTHETSTAHDISPTSPDQHPSLAEATPKLSTLATAATQASETPSESYLTTTPSQSASTLTTHADSTTGPHSTTDTESGHSTSTTAHQSALTRSDPHQSTLASTATQHSSTTAPESTSVIATTSATAAQEKTLTTPASEVSTNTLLGFSATPLSQLNGKVMVTYT